MMPLGYVHRAEFVYFILRQGTKLSFLFSLVAQISSKISYERFLKLSADYEAEQKELTERVKAWRQAVETFEQDQADFVSFVAIVRSMRGSGN